jgi:hypothetical protein
MPSTRSPSHSMASCCRSACRRTLVRRCSRRTIMMPHIPFPALLSRWYVTQPACVFPDT